MFKRFISILLTIATILTTVMPLGGCSVSKNNITMGNWLTQISSFYGMESYQQEEPYLKNVPSSDEYFDAFQMAVEWEIIDSNSSVSSNDIVTWKTALVTLVNAGGFLKAEASDEEKIDYAIENFDNSIRKYWMNRNIDSENALLLLSKSQNMWATKKYSERKEEFKLNDNVISLSSNETIDYSLQTITTTDNDLKEGDIFEMPSNDLKSEKTFCKITSVEENNGQKIAKYSTEVELQDVYEELFLQETIIPTAENTVIYDGNGNLVSSGTKIKPQSKSVDDESPKITTLAYSGEKPEIVNCAEASQSYKFTIDGNDITISYKLNGELDLKVSVKNQNLLSKDYISNHAQAKARFEEEFEISDLSVTHDFDWAGLKLKSASLKIDYKTKNKLAFSYSDKASGVFAPEYSNGNGKFLTNFKRAILKDVNGKGAKTIASKKIVKVCSLNVYSVGVAKVCLDVNLTLSFDGSVSITVTESGSKGVEYKNGNVRFIKTCTKSCDGELKAKVEFTIGMGPALYVIGLKKRLVGLEVKGGAGATASLKAHLADSEMHLFEELDFNDMSPEIVENTSVDGDITASLEEVQAVAQAQGGIFKADAGYQAKLHIDWCINVNVYAILKVGITDESYLTDFLGGKEVKLNIDIFNEKNATFFNLHIDNFNFKGAVLSFGFKEAKGDHCTLKYVPFDKGTDEEITEEEITERNDGILTGDNLILSTMNVSMDVGQTYLLNITQVPKGYSSDDIIFSSKDKSIATVDKNGVIKAVDTGCALIYAETSDHKYKALVSVIVVGESDVDFEPLIV